MLPALEACRRILVSHKVYSLTIDSFFDKYISPLEVWSDAYESLSDQYTEIVLTNEQQRGYRKCRRDNRGKWKGGGFGIEGALKGAATAGALNIVEGVGYTLFNFAGNIASNISESNKKSRIFNDPQTVHSLCLALWKTVFFMHFALTFCIKDQVGNTCFIDGMVLDSHIAKAEAMMKNLDLIVDQVEKEVVLLQIPEINPYSKDWYIHMYNSYGDPDGELEHIANYFGISVISDYKEKTL